MVADQQRPYLYALHPPAGPGQNGWLLLVNTTNINMNHGLAIGTNPTDLAIHYPDRVNKVIAYGANYNPSGVRSDIGENEKFNALIAKAAEDYQHLSPTPDRWDAFLENLSHMWATEPNFTPEQLGAITTPVLILDGKEEEVIYTDHTKEMADLIPTAELIIVPGTGHFGVWEKPEEFNHIMLDFLAR